ncbi:transposase [Streptomyces sp. CG1]|uniref:helix-turn-helix domain-containing protein n=1 Tax=Streptomyces sp. CG1 TaxID=1287523 RepID=UPI0034E1C558
MAKPLRARRLTDEEGGALLRIVWRGRNGTIKVRRVVIIMASASGNTNEAIAALVAADPDPVRDVIHAFNERGLDCLDPKWAGGRPRRITADDEAYIVGISQKRPRKLGMPFTRWSLRKLVGYLSNPPAGCAGWSSAASGCGCCCTATTSPSSASVPGSRPAARTPAPSWTASRR